MRTQVDADHSVDCIGFLFAQASNILSYYFCLPVVIVGAGGSGGDCGGGGGGGGGTYPLVESG
jgi:hypothetical protein